MGGASTKGLVGGIALLLVAAGCAPSAVKVAAPTPKPTHPNADPNAEVVRYCAGTVTEWDEHRCIWELTPEQQRHRSYSQRLTIRAGRVVRFETITGSGAIREGEESSEYEYEGPSIRSWRQVNRNGVVKGLVTVSESGDWVRWLDAKERPRPASGTKVSGLRRTFDARGRVVGYVYVDAFGNPAPHEGGVFEKRLKRAQSGAVIEEAFFGQQGEAMLGPQGAHRVTFQVDAHGNESERRYFDPGGEPMSVKGVGIVRSKYDDFGNPIELAYFTLEGQPALDPDEDSAVVRKVRDQRGNEVEWRGFSELGKPVVGARGGARRMRYDENDALVELSYLADDGKPTRPPALDYAIKRQLRDERGNVILESYFDENGAPLLLADGYHSVQIAYDARDNPIAYGYDDVSGAPITLPQRYHARRLTYDGDRMTRTDFLSSSGSVSDTQNVGYAPDGTEIQLGRCVGKVSAELIAAIQARAATSRSCYERLLVKVPDARGKLLVGMRIEESGAIASVSIVQDEMHEAGLTSCVKTKLMESRFPRGPEGGCAEVNVPIRFEPKKNDPPTP